MREPEPREGGRPCDRRRRMRGSRRYGEPVCNGKPAPHQLLAVKRKLAIGRPSVDVALFPKEKPAHGRAIRRGPHYQTYLCRIRKVAAENREIVLIQIEPRARVAAEIPDSLPGPAPRQLCAQGFAILRRQSVRGATQVLAGDELE